MKPAAAIFAAIALASAPTATLLVLGAKESPPAAPTPTGGDLVQRNGTYSLRLTSEPCPVDELAEWLEEVGIPPARAYVETSGARQAGGCWAFDAAGDVLKASLGGSPEDLPIPIGWFQREAT